MPGADPTRILYVEPFEGGSHAAFSRVLTAGIPAQWTTLTLPGRHWKWRMRGSAAFACLARARDVGPGYDLLFVSSFTPLAELLGLCPGLAGVPSVLYFHENQLAYPSRIADPAGRDHHFGFTQMVSALAATRCVFNSAYNRDSFLAEAAGLLARMPDAVPPGWVEAIAAKSTVLGVPLELEDRAPRLIEPNERSAGPTLLWNHRWEHDKNPESFFAALERLVAMDIPFRVIVCGEQFRRSPRVFENLHGRLGSRLVHCGFAPSRSAYEALLAQSDIVVSTAVHEFFGIGVLEAVHFGARPLVPDRLAYPEHFEPAFRYRDDDLVTQLARLARDYVQGRAMRADRRQLTRPHLAEQLLPRYQALLRELIAR